MSHLLIIDDDASLCRSLQIHLKREGHSAELEHSGGAGLKRASAGTFDLVLLDLGLPDADGLDVLEGLLAADAERPVVVITARQDMGGTLAAMRNGAFDYLRKPFEWVEILMLLQKVERSRHRSRATARPAAGTEPVGPHEIIGNSTAMLDIIKQIGLLSRTAVTVLIEGESGTGKELVARVLHDAGAAAHPFVPVNCSAIVPTLFESELFGHEKGAFTGAEARRIGRLEQAGAGTLFLDEIGDMPLELQAKLLRVLQERTFERVGGGQSLEFKARIVAATNRDLKTMLEEGTFREDLYFRLAVSPIRIPPLRERREDIPALAMHLLRRRARELHAKVTGIEKEALRKLEMYDWPGNIRELENVLTRAIALARGRTLGVDDVAFVNVASPGSNRAGREPRPLREVEKDAIEETLQFTGGNLTQAAKLLEITRTTLRKKIADYNIS